ncbi:MAG: metallophosphoesterase [Clostridia bacterium]|nr:metallophosphoesterase [Clostridia bacterium]
MKKELQIIKNTIHIGIEKSIRFLHITDTHITRDDPFNGRRVKTFDVDYEGCAEDYYFQAIDYAKRNNLPILHTGDLIDFFSKGNFDFIDQHFEGLDYMYAAGNHDFCHFLGKAKEDYAYKWEKIKEIAPHIKNNLYFDSRIIGGVNFVTLDNSYYLIGDGQTEMLKAEVAKGHPIILAMHVPLYTKGLAETVMQEHPCAYVVAAPEELLSTYPDDRRAQQMPDSATLRAVEYIKNEPLIKALIVGHTHLNFEEMLTEDKCQYATHGSFAGYVREFTVI